MKHLAFVLLVACGSSDSELDADVVTNIPPGDATGTTATGSYRMETLTTDCDGQCRASEISACDVGTRLEDTVEVVQDNGALQIDIDGSDYVSRMTGGIDTDGTFDVGGLRTQLGGAVTITARSRGSFDGTMMTGTARLRVRGSGLDCLIDTEVTGARR